MTKKSHQKGFTLIELLVAIGIFAVMSVMAYAGLSNALITQEGVAKQSDRLAELQKTMLIISRDVEQAINRPVRDAYGTEVAAFEGGGYGSSILEFSRTGRPNPMAAQRSHLQRVAYLVSEEQLLRQVWMVVDRAIDTVPFESTLLNGVSAVELRFMDEKHEWQTQWPQSNFQTNQTAPPSVMPRALEITLELEDWGELRRVFEVVGG